MSRLFPFLLVLAMACNASRVSEASCSVCTAGGGGDALSEDDCEAFGRAADCMDWQLDAPASGGCIQCSFTECSDSPECFTPDAGDGSP